jgi:hypothetical protein
MLHGDAPIIPQLGLHPPLRGLVPQLQAKILVKPIDPLGVHRPTFPSQQHVNTPIAIAHARLRDLLDPLLDVRLAAAFGFVDIQRPVDPQGRTSAPDRDFPVGSQLVDKLPLAARRQCFFASTS